MCTYPTQTHVLYELSVMAYSMSNGSCNVATELSAAQRYVAANYVFGVAASVACLVMIVLMITTRAHRSYIHRLTLYLAIASFFSSVSIGLSVVPADLTDPISLRNGWNPVCVTIGFLLQYFAFSSTLATIWLCINVFALAICRAKLGQRKVEIAGLLIIFLAPALLSWIPLVKGSYGLTTVWCWIQGPCAKGSDYVAGEMFGASVAPVFVMYIISLVLIAIISLRLCVQLKKTPVRDTHSAALKEVLPLLIYPGTYSLVFAAATFGVFYASFEEQVLASDFFAVVLSLVQAVRMLLPLSFLAHPSLRRKVCAVLKPSSTPKRRREEYETDICSDIRTTAASSRDERHLVNTCTEFSKCTEKDPILRT